MVPAIGYVIANIERADFASHNTLPKVIKCLASFSYGIFFLFWHFFWHFFHASRRVDASEMVRLWPVNVGRLADCRRRAWLTGLQRWFRNSGRECADGKQVISPEAGDGGP